MKIAERYNALPIEKQNIAVTIVFSLLIFCGLLFLGLVGHIGVALGFLAGSIVQIACYLTVLYGASLISGEGVKRKGVAIVLIFTFGRFLLYGGLLVLAAFCTYRWNFPYLNLWGTFAGYMPLYIIIFVHSLIRRHDEKKEGDAQ